MDSLADWLIASLSRENDPVGLIILAGAAAVEYIFPPFPGDAITLFGATLISARGWSFWAVFAAVMLGSIVGSMTAFALGQRLGARRARAPADPASAADAAGKRARLDRMIACFERHGAAYLVLNRFVPGVRALFFVAAGLAGMRPLAVLLCSAASAAAWNLSLIALGATFGASYETMLDWVRQYTLAVVLVGCVAAALVALRAVTRRRSNR